ncbi:MAG: hypothetical protein GTO02_19480 [Candidatus Dadabacteria bacterium]|nr:hypothetical protein [Candidatus Dadabacteria bacterium]
MRIEHWTHKDVDENGLVLTGGAVNTEPKIDVTWKGEGCDCASCQSIDCYIRVNLGRDMNGTVRGMTIYFNSDSELREYLLKDAQILN